MASKAITLNEDKLITLELLKYYHGKSLAEIKELIDKKAEIAISNTMPTDENTKIWIDTSEQSEVSIPEINDAATSTVDTWSSDKISKQIVQVTDDIINTVITENLMTTEDVDRMFEEVIA